MIDSYAYCYFVTHYTQLTSLADMYTNVTNIHLKVAYNAGSLSNNTGSLTSTSSASSTDVIKFTHAIGSGPSDIKHGYGMCMYVRVYVYSVYIY